MRQQPLPYRIALGGTLASFCLLFLFITGVLPMFYLIMPMLCSLLILIMAETTSPYWAFIMYLAVGVLSLFITPNKDASLIFILFFGHYPLLRPIANNRASADFMIHSTYMNTEYEHEIINFKKNIKERSETL